MPSLSNALSSLRRSLGAKAITTRDADVALSPDALLSVDALELAALVECREHARAVELYGGPFLDGCYVDASSTFDQWMSRERRRVEALFLQACSQQCGALARARRARCNCDTANCLRDAAGRDGTLRPDQ
jgi:DNA-binding SARP family transcriptional activator